MSITPDQQRQLILESEMVDSGIAAYRKALAKTAPDPLKQGSGCESTTQGASDIVKRLVEPFADAIQTYLDAQEVKKAGRRAAVLDYLHLVDPKAMAFITLRNVLDGLSRPRSLTALQCGIGRNIEDEVRLMAFKGEKPALFRKLRTDLPKRTSNRRHTRSVLIRYANKCDNQTAAWPDDITLKVGFVLRELLEISTGLITTIIERKSKTRTEAKIVATEAGQQVLADSHARCALLHPTYLPMIIAPNDWTSTQGGGYIGDRVNRDLLRFVKTSNQSYLADLDATEMMQPCYDAANRMQRVGWRINPSIREVAGLLWDAGTPCGDAMPSTDAIPLPPRPTTAESHPDYAADHKSWKRQASNVYNLRTQQTSKVVSAQRLLTLAEKFQGEQALYFPYQADFRGRLYPTPQTLNPQGNDLAKALLEFSEGAAITTPEALSWLAITGAGLYGYDKTSLEDRVQWAEDHHDQIIASACDPLENRWWMDADKPFQFLAFCFDWFGYSEEGSGYVSHFPCQVDGTCNGLQNLAAMVRDEVSGEAVNLCPSENPNDIYARVAEAVVKTLSESDDIHAATWLVYGIDRKITKRPVMVLPYGGTQHSCRTAILEDLKKAATRGTKANPFSSEQEFAATQLLTRHIWQALGSVAVAATQIMAWFGKVAKVANHFGLPLIWQTPSGFIVQQQYVCSKSRKIELTFPQSITAVRRQLRLRVDDHGTLDKKKQASAISPNFVHSMDSSHLVMSVNAAEVPVATVHDAYLVRAADCEHLGQCIREQFVKMYSESDVLSEFLDGLEKALPLDADISQALKGETHLPDPPPFGDLDLAGVINSQYFFC